MSTYQATIQWRRGSDVFTDNRYSRRHDIAFGPYLCLGALILVVRWRALWHEWAEPIFALGWWIPTIVLICLFLMGFLLSAWQAVKSRWMS